MSKKLIAGAGVVASFAIALAPLATFADRATNASDQHTDQLVVNVPATCTFGSYTKEGGNYPGGITHDNYTSTTGQYGATEWDVDGTTTDGHDTGNHNTADAASTGYPSLAADIEITGGTANASKHTVHRTMMAGSTTDTFAQTTMYIVCNNGEGYTVTANAAANLTDGTNNIPVAATYSATASGYNLKSITATGATAKVATVTATGETEIATKTSPSVEAGDTVTVTYGMGIASSQPAGTYAGEVVYKLYKGVTSGN